MAGSDIKKRLAQAEQAEIDEVESFRKKLNDFRANDPKLKYFRQQQYPLCVQILRDFAKEIGYIMKEETPQGAAFAQFEFRTNLRTGFWGRHFPLPSEGRWEFRFGEVSMWRSVITEVYAVSFMAYDRDGVLKKKLSTVPGGNEEVKKWFNDVLFECYKVAENNRYGS